MLAAAFAFCATHPSKAETEEPAALTPAEVRLEVFTGADAVAHAWSIYSGLTYAPFAGLHHDGLRLRTVGGYGSYRYSGLRWNGSLPVVVTFRGRVVFADALIGYHRQLGPLTLKLFAGLTAADHDTTPFDPESSTHGTHAGGKAMAEAWWTMNERAWASLDVAWASVHNDYGSRVRLGWRVTPELSLGVEAGAAGNDEYDNRRGGGFVRYEWASGEVSLSAGFSRDSNGASEPFATLNWLTRF
jgi:hypothetical protein